MHHTFHFFLLIHRNQACETNGTGSDMMNTFTTSAVPSRRFDSSSWTSCTGSGTSCPGSFISSRTDWNQCKIYSSESSSFVHVSLFYLQQWYHFVKVAIALNPKQLKTTHHLPHSVCPVAVSVVSVGVLQAEQVSPAFALYSSGGQAAHAVNGGAEPSPAGQGVQAPFPTVALIIPAVHWVQPVVSGNPTPPYPAAHTEMMFHIKLSISLENK